jgi:Zn-dependent protease with chaperone function
VLIAALVPLLIGVGLAVATRPLATRLRPGGAARILLLGMVVSAATMLATLGLLAWFAVATVPTVADLGRWRGGDVVAHGDVPLPVALLAAAALVGISVRLVIAARRHLTDLREVVAFERRLSSWRRPPRLVVIDEPAPVAHAVTPLPGCGGHIVVSTGLHSELSSDELRRAVIEHERAHLRHHHGVLLGLGALAVVVNPLLAPSLAELRFQLERWADEEAATRTSPATVAEAVATVALAHRHARPALAFDGAATTTTTARINALLNRSRCRRAGPPAALIAGLTATAVVATAVACRHTELLFEGLRNLRTG